MLKNTKLKLVTFLLTGMNFYSMESRVNKANQNSHQLIQHLYEELKTKDIKIKSLEIEINQIKNQLNKQLEIITKDSQSITHNAEVVNTAITTYNEYGIIINQYQEQFKQTENAIQELQKKTSDDGDVITKNAKVLNEAIEALNKNATIINQQQEMITSNQDNITSLKIIFICSMLIINRNLENFGYELMISIFGCFIGLFFYKQIIKGIIFTLNDHTQNLLITLGEYTSIVIEKFKEFVYSVRNFTDQQIEIMERARND